MWAAIFKFLKSAGLKAAEIAKAGGKEVIKKAFEPITNVKDLAGAFKEGGLKSLGKEALNQSPVGSLEEAFNNMSNKETFGKGLGQLSNISQQKPQQETQSVGGISPGMADRMGILGFIGQQGIGESPKTATTDRGSIISGTKPFVRQTPPMESMQYVPGPQGSVIGGQGEIGQGFGMQSPQSSIPPAYMGVANPNNQRPLQNMANVQATAIPLQYRNIVNNPSIKGQPMQAPQQQQLTPGAFAGMKEGILGMPSSAYGQDYQGQEGRETAYYAGKLIPDIIRSKLGINTTGEEARQQQTIETSKRSVDREGRKIENQDLARANQLRKEFIDRPEIKDYMLIKNKAGTMDALLNDALSGNQENKVALDQGLITLFNKITDPTSVVRESEYARTPANLPIVNRFNGAFAKLQTGGAGLTDDDRKALVWGAKIMANQAGTMFNERASQYSDIAMSYGVDPQLVIAGVGEYKPYSKQPEYSQQLQDNQIQAGWTQDKEVRYQELLKKRGR
jgi:hypothetical protein